MKLLEVLFIAAVCAFVVIRIIMSIVNWWTSRPDYLPPTQRKQQNERIKASKQRIKELKKNGYQFKGPPPKAAVKHDPSEKQAATRPGSGFTLDDMLRETAEWEKLYQSDAEKQKEEKPPADPEKTSPQSVNIPMSDMHCFRMSEDGLKPFADYKSRDPLEIIGSAEKLWVMYNRCLGEDIPTIDPKGFAWIFTCGSYAEIIKTKNAGIDLEKREFTADGFRSFVKSWGYLGIEKAYIDPGIENGMVPVTRAQILGAEDQVYFGYAYNHYAIRAIQNRENSRSNPACVQMFNACLTMVYTIFRGNLLLLAPTDPVKGWDRDTLHVTHGAKELLKGQHGYSADGQLRVYGSEGLKLSDKTEDAGALTYRLARSPSRGEELLCGYTDTAAAEKMFGSSIQFTLISYNELIELYDRHRAQVAGIAVNPGGKIWYASDSEELERIKKIVVKKV